MCTPANDRDHPLARDFRAFIEGPGLTCVGAKAALDRDGMRFVVALDSNGGAFKPIHWQVD